MLKTLDTSTLTRSCIADRYFCCAHSPALVNCRLHQFFFNLIGGKISKMKEFKRL